MSIEHVEPSNISSTPPVAQPASTEESTRIRPIETPQSAKNRMFTPRLNWRDGIYLLTLVLLVVAMAYRYTPQLNGEVPGMWWDPLLNIWTMTWDTNTLLHAPTHLWQAPLLYPNNLTLSYSENLLGEAFFFAPFYLLSHNPVLAYNLTFYLAFVLCGINMYFLARYHTGKPFAAFIAALIYAFAPYRLGQIDHIHIVAGEWIPLVFLYLDLSLKKGRWYHWSLLALFYALQLLSSIYYGIFLIYTLIAYVILRYTKPFLLRLWKERGEYIKYLLISAIKPLVAFTPAVIFIYLFMKPYLVSLDSGLGRRLDHTVGYAAFIRDFRFASPANWLYGMSSYNGIALPFDNEHYLFLGWSIVVLAALGVVLAFRRHEPTIRAYVWTGLIVLLFAFGPVLQYSTPDGVPPTGATSPIPYQTNLPMPWLFAYRYLPGFNGLRVPARLIGVLLLVLAILGAYGVAWLQDLVRQNAQARQDEQQPAWLKIMLSSPEFLYLRTFFIRCVLILAPLLLLLEAVPAYLPVTHVPTGNQIPPVYQWLATHGGSQPIVELPMAALSGNIPLQDEAWYDYYTIYHPHPIANGWSGNRPPLTYDMANTLLSFPSSSSLALLKKYHISYVVLHLQLFKPSLAATLLAQAQASPGLTQIAVFGTDSVWQVK